MAVKDRSISQTLDLAKRAQRRGAIQEARALYEEVLSRFPANRRAKDGLLSLDTPDPAARRVDQAQVDTVLALYRSGDYEKALKQATALHHKAPEIAALSDIRAACLRAMGAPDKALAIYQASLKGRPDDAQLWRNCGAALNDLQKLSEAEGCFAKACDLSPDSADHWYILAECREMRGHHRPALQAVTRALELDPGHADALNLLGSLLRDLGEIDLANQTHKQVLNSTRAPRPLSAAQTNLGILAAAQGKTEEAKAFYTQAIETRPDNIQAHRNLVRLTRYTPDHPHLTQLRNLVKRPDLPIPDQSVIHFAMFEALDQLDDTETAFFHLARGNALRQAQLRYDIGKDATLFNHLKALTEEVPPAPRITQGPRPIFIVGMPRSGTTLSECILAGAAGVHSAGEIPALGNAASAMLRRLRDGGHKVLEKVELEQFETSLRAELALYARGAPVITCKTPLDFRWAGLTLAAMPDARVVHLVRDPVENSWSNYRTCFSSNGNGFAYDQANLARFCNLHRMLMQYWKQRFPERILTLPYSDLTRDFEDMARRLVSFCGLGWSDACLRPDAAKSPVLTASAAQVRKPVYNGNRGDWRRYEAHLTPLLEGLAQNEIAL
ncbi:tetratricopeptide repeat protein [Roseovarius sp. A21]|uniref:Tetratricopeptide repeat protein n=1 Tax=Roseovarius bejariae TaxID=2576383 RepID=A0A844CI73_9RHOB|nr:tetratricopeptide repeat-containing sulfotransferase family protein [Roseovarius bejariae]MRU15021.1 tetratricopeptide repeat protein [Roseovarius bejariae]